MTAEDYPRLSTLTALAYQLNMRLEDGDHGVTFADVYDGLSSGHLWQMLREKIPGIDVGLFEDAQWRQRVQLLRVLRDAAEFVRGRERRKTGIEKSGLALLITFVLEAIQQEWWVPDSGSRFVERPTN